MIPIAQYLAFFSQLFQCIMYFSFFYLSDHCFQFISLWYRQNFKTPSPHNPGQFRHLERPPSNQINSSAPIHHTHSHTHLIKTIARYYHSLSLSAWTCSFCITFHYCDVFPRGLCLLMKCIFATRWKLQQYGNSITREEVEIISLNTWKNDGQLKYFIERQ